jgi:hypothetical protein
MDSQANAKVHCTLPLGGVPARIKEHLNLTQYRVTIYAAKLTGAMYPD